MRKARRSALDRRGPRTRHRLRRRQPRHRRHAVHGVSVVGRAAGQEPPRSPASRGGSARRTLDLGASRAAGEFADELGRQALFRRRRTGAMDRAIPAVDGDLGPCASVALHPRRLVVRPARHTWVFNTGLQPGRPPICIVLDIDEGAAFWLAAGEAQCIDLQAPLQRPAAPISDPPPWLTSLGRIADPSLARPARRQVDHALQDFADHREMVALAGILMHQVGQIGVATLSRCASSRAINSATAGWSRRNAAASSNS